MQSQRRYLTVFGSILTVLLVALGFLLAGISECDSDSDGDGYTVLDGDCDDNDPAVHPGATEVCNGIDDDCDGEVDEEATWFRDNDGDGYGSTAHTVEACEAPAGYVAGYGDCDDTNPDISPAAVEVCNGIDDNCDHRVDELATWFPDSDGDGYGVETEGIKACVAPRGYVGARGDCDDRNPAVHPFATEASASDGVDQDCGGTDGQDPAVASPASSIQGALDAAADGQVVWVGPGTYYEHDLNFHGKRIALVSTHLQGRTIIETQTRGRGFVFMDGETGATRLDGFSIFHAFSTMGAGIYIEAAGPTLTNLNVSWNTSYYDNGTYYPAGGWGAAIYMKNASPSVTHAVFADNQTAYGAGIYADEGSTPTLLDVFFGGNRGSSSGGGLFVSASSSHVTLTHGTFAGNKAAEGAGMTVQYANVDLTNVLFVGNSTESWVAGQGGGMYIFYGFDQSSLTNVVFDQNVSWEGGGIFMQADTSPTLTNVIFTRNQAEQYGGAMSILYADVQFTNATIVGNVAGYSGGLRVSVASPSLKNVILAYNSPYNVSASENSVSLDYCILYAPPGQENYSDAIAPSPTTYTFEPGFLTYDADGLPTDLHLAADSPAVDAGAPAIADPDGSRSDMGAYGGPSAGSYDLDNDGYPDYFWPGTINDAPTGFDPADYDQDDRNAKVH